MNSFEKLPNSPTPQEAILVPETESPIFMPSIEYFQKESRYWVDQQRVALEKSQKTKAVLADNLAQSFGGLKEYRLAVGAMISQVMPRRQDMIDEWYRLSTSVVAFSLLWRQLLTQMGQVSAKNMCADFDEGNPEKRGFHAKAEPWMELGLEWPQIGNTSWYEGDAVYLRTKRPADTSPSLPARYEQCFGTPFDIHAFATATPYLKREVWIGLS